VKLMLLVLAAALGLAGAAAADPSAVLTAVRNKVIENIRRMPNYTCVQTIERSYYMPAGRAPANCEQIASPGAPLKLMQTDRLRLEVAVSPDRELYSWVGARSFGEGEISDIVRFGPIGTGSFAAYLGNVFGGRITRMTYLGVAGEGGRSLMKFGYSVPKEQSRYRVRAGDGWVITAFEGTVLADAATGDLVELTIRTVGLPRETSTCESRSTLHYSTFQIGDAGFLLPREVRQRFVAITGMESENVSTFSACREYRGESVVHFDADPDAVAAEAKKKEAAALQLRPGLLASIEWTSPVDPATAAAGDVLSARLAQPLRDRHTRAVVPAGAAIEGRIVRIQINYTSPPSVVLVRRVETIEIDGVRVPFPVRYYSDFEALRAAGRSPYRPDGATPVRERMPGEEDCEALYFRPPRRLPAGQRSSWVTTKPPTAASPEPRR
jgi:hypothetical protein